VRGDAVAVATLCHHRAELLWQLGELSAAEAEASIGHSICVEQGWKVGQAGLAAALIDLRLERGEIASAARLLDAWLAAPAGALPDVYTLNALLAARGRLRIAEGQPHEALVDLLECGRRLTELGELSPALVSWRRTAALVHLSLGDVAEAHRLADEELELARKHGGARALGMALRVAGLVRGGDAGAGLLSEAVTRLEHSEARLEHARVLVDLGATLRRAGRLSDARKRLAEGMDIAHRCGATSLVEGARVELRRAGARPRRAARIGPEALTPSEQRVARMAAGGMTNKEIAQALFVTLRTVEMHLSNAYGKLGIRSRSGLGRALGDGE
jgi:DNA-binding CsgD family transcriptional regulator